MAALTGAVVHTRSSPPPLRMPRAPRPARPVASVCVDLSLAPQSPDASTGVAKRSTSENWHGGTEAGALRAFALRPAPIELERRGPSAADWPRPGDGAQEHPHRRRARVRSSPGSEWRSGARSRSSPRFPGSSVNSGNSEPPPARRAEDRRDRDPTGGTAPWISAESSARRSRYRATAASGHSGRTSTNPSANDKPQAPEGPTTVATPNQSGLRRKRRSVASTSPRALTSIRATN